MSPFCASLSSDTSEFLACWQPLSTFSLLSNARPLCCSSLTPPCLQALGVVLSLQIVSLVPLYRKSGSCLLAVCLWLYVSNQCSNRIVKNFFCISQAVKTDTNAHKMQKPKWCSNNGLILSHCLLLRDWKVSTCVCIFVHNSWHTVNGIILLIFRLCSQSVV